MWLSFKSNDNGFAYFQDILDYVAKVIGPISKHQLSPVLKKLREMGYIYRDNKKPQKNTITDSGKKLAAQALQNFSACSKEFSTQIISPIAPVTKKNKASSGFDSSEFIDNLRPKISDALSILSELDLCNDNQIKEIEKNIIEEIEADLNTIQI